MGPWWQGDVSGYRRLNPQQFGREYSSLWPVLPDKAVGRALTDPEGSSKPTPGDNLVTNLPVVSPGDDSSQQELGEHFWIPSTPNRPGARMTHPGNDCKPELDQTWVWNSQRLWLVEKEEKGHSCCQNKIPQTGWLKQQKLISHNSGALEVQDQGASNLAPGGGRALLLARGQLSS